MDIEYAVELKMQDKKYLNGMVYSYEYIKDTIEVSLYEIGKIKDNQLEINIAKFYIPLDYLKSIKQYKAIWDKEYDKIVMSKQNNYDKWIELWRIDEKTGDFKFFNDNLPGKAIFKYKGGQRPNRKWTDSISIEQLEWREQKDLI